MDDNIYLNKRKKFSLIADSIGVAHFIVALFTVVIGQFAGYNVSGVVSKTPGLELFYKTLGAPFFPIFYPVINAAKSDMFWTYVVGFLVITIASIFYGLMAYLIFRFLAFMFQ